MAMATSIDRQTTTPFHLKLFYRLNAFHSLADFPTPSPPPRGIRGAPISGPNAITRRSPPPQSSVNPPLPSHLQIYTWQSCTLRELSHLLTSALPSLLPDPPVGTRICFRLIYPDARGAATLGPDAKGRYLSKDFGNVIVGPRDSPDQSGDAPASGGSAFRLQGSDADRTLQEMRFVIGDYVDCAILPPLDNGDVAPPLVSGRGPVGGGPPGGGMRAFRENGFGRPGRGRGDRFGGMGIPSGDWRRGERLPDGGRGSGRGRRGWGPY